MKNSTRYYRLIVSLVFLALALAACNLSRPSGPQIKVQNVWARPSRISVTTGNNNAMGQGKNAAMGATSAVYMTLVNRGNQSDRLVGVKSDIASHVELHQTIMKNNVMHMQPVEGGLEIPAGGQVQLKPGSYHIMLINLKRELKPGDRFSVVLEFEKSGRKTIQVDVKEP